MIELVGALLKNWKWIGLGLLVLALGFQSIRLDHAKHDLASARQLAATNAANWKAMRDAITGPGGWKAQYAALQARREREGELARDAVSLASTARLSAADRSFDQGYAAGRALCRPSPGGSNAESPVAAPSPGPGRVSDPSDDLAALWRNSAPYRP